MLSAVFPLPSAWNGQVAASPVPTLTNVMSVVKTPFFRRNLKRHDTAAVSLPCCDGNWQCVARYGGDASPPFRRGSFQNRSGYRP